MESVPGAPDGEVVVSGFSSAEHMFIESVRAEGASFLQKLRKRVLARSLRLRVKSSVHGSSKIYEVLAAVRLVRGTLNACASARDLNSALRRSFYELSGQAERLSGRKAGIRAKERPRGVFA